MGEAELAAAQAPGSVNAGPGGSGWDGLVNLEGFCLRQIGWERTAFVLGKGHGCSATRAPSPSFPPACRHFLSLPGPFCPFSSDGRGLGFCRHIRLQVLNHVWILCTAVLLMKTSGLPPHKPVCS